jgi:hypothetical protein
VVQSLGGFACGPVGLIHAHRAGINTKSPPWDDVRYTSVFGRKSGHRILSASSPFRTQLGHGSEFHAPRFRGFARECELTKINMVCLFLSVDAVPSIPREVLMRILALAIFGMLSIGPATAQTYDPAYPVCLHVYKWGANLSIGVGMGL